MGLSFYHPDRLLFLLLIVVACFAGCRAVGPDYCGICTPVLPVNYESPLGCETNDSTCSLACQTHCDSRQVLFSDPVLNSLVARAEQQNLSLCEAYQRIVEARSWAKVARGGLFPQADAIAEYGLTKRSSNARPFVGTNGVAFDLFSLGFDSSWEIDLFGKLRRQVEVSQAELAAQHDNFQDVRLTLFSDVATNYVRVRVLQQQLHIAQQNLKLQEETSELIEQLQKAGKVTTLDVAQAKSLRYATMSEVPVLEQQLQLAFNQLSILLGEAPGCAMRACIGYGPIPTPPELCALGIPADLVRRRPDIRRAEQEIVAASARIGVAKADLYPQLSLLGALSVDSRKVSSLFTSESLTFSVGPSFRWNILNFWRVTSSIHAYEAQYAQAMTRYRAAVLNAVREVEDGLGNNHWEQFRKIALEQTTLADAKSVELSLSRYRAGKASYQRVLDSQTQLLRDEQKLAISRGALALELIRISKAVGGGWCPTATTNCQGSASPSFPSGDSLFSVPNKPTEDSSKKKPSKPTAQPNKPKPKPTKPKPNKPEPTETKPADPKPTEPTSAETKPTESSDSKSSNLPTLKEDATPQLPMVQEAEPLSSPDRASIVAPKNDSLDEPGDEAGGGEENNSSSDTLWRLPSPREESQAKLDGHADRVVLLPLMKSRTIKKLGPPSLVRLDPFLTNVKRSAKERLGVAGIKNARLHADMSSVTYSSPKNFAPQIRFKVPPANAQSLWRKLAIGLLSLVVVGLAFSLLKIVSRRGQ